MASPFDNADIARGGLYADNLAAELAGRVDGLKGKEPLPRPHFLNTRVFVAYKQGFGRGQVLALKMRAAGEDPAEWLDWFFKKGPASLSKHQLARLDR